MNRHKVHNIIVVATIPVALLLLAAYPPVRDYYWSHYVTKAEWQSRDMWSRLCLARPIERYGMLQGMTVEEVVDMLGDPSIPGWRKVEPDGRVSLLCYTVSMGGGFDSVALYVEFVGGVVIKAEIGPGQ